MPGSDSEVDQRTDFGHDRDRIIYSSAFRRLSGITQVFSVDHVAPVHNRFSHSIKVGQLGRRIAEYLSDPARTPPSIAARFGLDVEVVEAACYAHDLGHPPFGHIGEDALAELVRANGDEEGYEGNAQAFRIITKLSLRSSNVNGLDLTRAVLCASIKYPWSFAEAQRRGTSKFGHYAADKACFDFAREWHDSNGWLGEQSVEAQVMDFADDIAYSVHDIEDCHRLNLIPWNEFRFGRDVSSAQQIPQRLMHDSTFAKSHPDRFMAAGGRILDIISGYRHVFGETYLGTRDQRIQIRRMGSKLIKRFLLASGLSIAEENGTAKLRIDESARDEIAFLKQIARTYVFNNPALGAQQRGQRRLIEEVFADLMEDVYSFMAKGRALKVAPIRMHSMISLDDTPRQDEPSSMARRTADCISALSEGELVALHRRLRGFHTGSASDPIVI